MEKKHRYSLRKTTKGLVSVMIAGVMAIPFATDSVSAETENQNSEMTEVHYSQPPEGLSWTANTVSEIAAEIEQQLTTQEAGTYNYVVQWGDTVWGITQAFDLDMAAFIEANGIRNPDLIYANEVVTLDVTGTPTNTVVSEDADNVEGVEDTVVAVETSEDTTERTTEDTSEKAVEDETTPEEPPATRAPGINDVVAPEPETVPDETPEDSANQETDEEAKEEEVIERPDLTEEEGEETSEVVDEEIIEDDNVEIPEDEDPVNGDIIDEGIIEEPEDTPEEETEPTVYERTIQREIVIEHGIIYVEDDSLPAGETVIDTEGQNGQRVQTIQQNIVDGEVESETVVNDEVVVEPVDQVIRIGTQQREVRRQIVEVTRPLVVQYVENPNVPAGEETVLQEGVPERIQEVYETVFINGEQTGEPQLIEENVLVPGEPRVIEIGTQEDIENPGTPEEPGENEPPVEDTEDFTFDQALFNQEFLNVINEERASLGVSPLVYDGRLQEGTNVRLAENISMGDISHNRPDGTEYRTAFEYLGEGYGYNLGENLAYRSFTPEDRERVESGEITLERLYAEIFFEQYANSPGHYANMINEDYIGFATASEIGEDGLVYNVQIFNVQP